MVISNHNSFPVLFEKKNASAYFIWKIYLYFSIGNGRPREPALCQFYRHTFVPHFDLLWNCCRRLSYNKSATNLNRNKSIKKSGRLDTMTSCFSTNRKRATSERAEQSGHQQVYKKSPTSKLCNKPITTNWIKWTLWAPSAVDGPAPRAASRRTLSVTNLRRSNYVDKTATVDLLKWKAKNRPSWEVLVQHSRPITTCWINGHIEHRPSHRGERVANEAIARCDKLARRSNYADNCDGRSICWNERQKNRPSSESDTTFSRLQRKTALFFRCQYFVKRKCCRTTNPQQI